MKRYCFALAALLVATPVFAQEHLEPDLSAMSGLPPLVDPNFARRVFPEAFDRDVRIRVLEWPAWSFEAMTGIRETAAGYAIFALESDRMKTPAAVDDRCETPIDRALAGRIIALWKTMLMQTRYRDPPWMGLDGADYAFAMGVGFSPMTGHIWSPREGTNPGRLVAISLAMYEVCKAPAKDWSKLERLTADLEKNLQGRQ